MLLRIQVKLVLARSTIFCFAVFSLSSVYSVDGIAEAEVVPEAPDTHTEWICRAGNSNQWVCTENTLPGPAFNKPPHRKPVHTASITPPDEPGIKVARNLDWVDERALTKDQRDAMAPGCCGAYIEPKRDYPDAELDPKQASLRATATTTTVQDNIATMTGDVQISQGYRQVRSDVAIVNQNDRSVELKGSVQFREPGLLMLGDRAFVNLDTQQIEIENASFVFHGSATRGTAGSFKRGLDDYVYLDNATYTTCEPGNNSWRLVAPHISINPDTGMATARHVKIEVKGVPVFYSPWLRFPVDGRRATGLLFPEISMGEDNGFEYAQPIYLNLAPNYDATVTPRYIQERGEMMALEFRHLSMLSELIIGGAYLADDDGGDDDDEEHPAKKIFAGEDRWLIDVDHDGGIGQAWSTHVDYTKVSDEDYFRDLGNVTLQASSATHLKQLAQVDYRYSNWWFRVKAAKYQTLIHRTLANKIERQYQQLPRVDAIGNYEFSPWGLDLELDLQHQYTEFDHRDSLNQIGAPIVTGTRLRTDYTLTLDKQWQMAYVRPALKLKYLSYDLDASVIAGGDDSPSVIIPVVTIDAGLFFERDTTWLTNHIQTFEPRLFYLNSDYKDQIDHPVFDSSELTFSYQQLFRDDRFSGGDRIGDAEQITIGFTSRLIDAATGIERLRGSLGQIFYFNDRYVSLDSTLTRGFLRSSYDPASLTPEARDIAADLLSDDSNIAGELAGYIARHWRFQSDILYDENNNKVDKGSFSFRYNDRENNIFNLSYRYTRKTQRIVDMGLASEKSFDADIEQADISAIFALNPSWSLIGRWNHDMTNSRELEVFGGIEYNSCCWRGSIILRHWIDRDDDLAIPEDELKYDDGIFFQIQLKGLGGTGSSVESILNDGIYGYETP